MPVTLEQQNEITAGEWFKQGIRPSFSHDMADNLTAGYGKLDFAGEWEYQLPFPAEQWIKGKSN